MHAPSKKIFLLIWLGCLIGVWSLLPYLHFLGTLPTTSFLKIGAVLTLQAACFYGLICWLSYKFIPKTDLNPFRAKSIDLLAIGSGLVVGLLLFFFDQIIFKQSALVAGDAPPFWAGALGSIYGAVNEEVLLRLFLFTFLYFLLRKISDRRLTVLWITNILVALAFGLAHLPAAAKLVPLSFVEVFRIILLNGFAGLVFGWLYWSRGLWAAMIAHFVADLVIHVFLI